MSHRRVFEDHCRRRELAYPVDIEGKPLWRPSSRAAAWRVSTGRGTVYATTVVRRRDEPPYDVSLVELDEGVRLMSRVEGVVPDEVQVGMRVRVTWSDDEPPVPLFVPEES